MPIIICKYYNPHLKIALGKWNQAFFIPTGVNLKPVALVPEYYRGALVFRLPGSSKRISYKLLKKNLVPAITEIVVNDFIMPF
jgi:hypothetical protein